MQRIFAFAFVLLYINALNVNLTLRTKRIILTHTTADWESTTTNKLKIMKYYQTDIFIYQFLLFIMFRRGGVVEYGVPAGRLEW